MTPPVLVWFLLASVWGSTWLFIKIGLDEGLPPITFAGIRFVVAAVPLVVWMLARGVRLPRRGSDWWLMTWTGVFTFSVNYGLVFWGESHISSGLAAILYSTFPILGMAMAHFLIPAEPITARKAGGVLLAVGGVVLIFWDRVRFGGALAVWGSVALVTAATVTAYANVMIKKKGTHIEPVTMSTVQIVVGFIPMLAVGIPLEGSPLGYNWSARAVVALLYLALVGSSVAFVLLYWLIQRMEVTRTQLIPLWSTLIAVILGAVVLGETLSGRILSGAGAILLGLYVATRQGETRGQSARRAFT